MHFPEPRMELSLKPGNEDGAKEDQKKYFDALFSTDIRQLRFTWYF